MKFSTIAATLAIAFAPTTSAWSLKLYKGSQYQGEIENRSGTVGQPCKNLPGKVNDQASSMHWDAGALNCEIVLFKHTGCNNQLGRSKGSWHVPKFSKDADNQISSYEINCFR